MRVPQLFFAAVGPQIRKKYYKKQAFKEK